MKRSTGADARRIRGSRLQRHRATHAIAEHPHLGLLVHGGLGIEKGDIGDRVLHDGIAGQRRAQRVELRPVGGVAEIEARTDARWFRGSIVGIRDQNRVAIRRQPLRHVAHRRTQSKRVGEQNYRGPLAAALRMDQRRIAAPARRGDLHIRIDHATRRRARGTGRGGETGGHGQRGKVPARNRISFIAHANSRTDPLDFLARV